MTGTTPTSARNRTNGNGTNIGNGTGSTMNAESVLSTWISSLSLTLLSHLTRSILPGIKVLSTPGAAQLNSDLGYLSNAVRALDVEWDELERWREAVGLDEEGWRERLREVRDGMNGRDGEGEDVWRRVGGMRG